MTASPASPHHPPTSTYRVQLNAGFTFADARAIVPYLSRLGIGALYTSPILCATPGSTHGYDVTDYASLNPEIGSEDDLHTLTDALRAHGMGLLVDVAPNHMGIAGGANAWWQDVLENARASAFADFFDIDWRPLKEELRGKILLPVLGDHYGVVLERGELKLDYADGAFTAHYFQTVLPIAPPTFPLILSGTLDRLTGDAGDEAFGKMTRTRHAVPLPRSSDFRLPTSDSSGVRAEFQSIITAFERLPSQHELDPDLVAERRREQLVAKRRLADLVAASPEAAQAIAATVASLNGDREQPRSYDALDRLLDAQSYRLSSFRTAGEEINYRRFFAINELAAIRQEVPAVFAAAHALLLRLVAAGHITGLRIDHPDGLWDPAGYFRDLQRAAWDVLNEGGKGEERGVAARGLRGEEEDEEPSSRSPFPLPPFPPQRSAPLSAAPPSPPLADRLPIYVVVEKILEPGESLPNDWAVHGTVGYEFARVATGLLVDPANQRAFDDLYTRVGGEGRRITFPAVAYEAKELMQGAALASETNVLARALNRISEQNRRTRDFTLSALRHALREVITAFPVYRTYVVCGELEVGSRKSEEEATTLMEALGSAGTVSVMADATLPPDPVLPTSDLRPPTSDHDRRAIEQAVALAKRRNPASDLSVFDFLEGILLLRDTENLSDAEYVERCRFVMKFQQLTGPVMAKGVEDTAFYRYNRLIALNEVGSDPAAFGVSVAEFHRANAERARRWPHGLLTSSTHDTKRSEDVRARIAVLSEVPREWRAAVNRWGRLNRRRKTRLDGALAPDSNDEYLFYQTVLGAWLWGMASPDDDFIARIDAFMLKAVREAQVHSGWINPDEAYEAALSSFVRAALDASHANPFLDALVPLRDLVAHAGAINALSQQLLKLTAPGVPDIYQGTELWDQSLVDPDNRRPVAYALRARLLDELAEAEPSPALARELLAQKADGRVKLYLTSRALAFRAAHPDLFARGDYVPLFAEGSAADHVVAFARRHGNEEVVVAVPRLVVGLTGKELVDPIGPEIWSDARVVIADAAEGTCYREVFSGEEIAANAGSGGATLTLSEVFAALPFALLYRTS